MYLLMFIFTISLAVVGLISELPTRIAHSVSRFINKIYKLTFSVGGML